jgi:hypothetical protein
VPSNRGQRPAGPTVLVLIDYFGRWPFWFDQFLRSCAFNPSIDWLITTDCEPPDRYPANVRFRRIGFTHYCEQVSDALAVRFRPDSPYNLCNIRPMLAVVQAEAVRNYDLWGWSDLDVIYGDIRRFYDEAALSHAVISTHKHICSGHFLLVRNEDRLRHAFRHIHGWRERLEDPGAVPWHQCLDEAHLTALFSPADAVRRRFARRLGTRAPDSSFWRDNLFRERWTTPFLPTGWLGGRSRSPERWFWNDGRLTSELTGRRQFLYLHLMNFKANRWVDQALYAEAPTWGDAPGLMDFGYADAVRSVRIDRAGIHAMASHHQPDPIDR